MKKSIFAIAAAVACMFTFSACQPEDQDQLLQLAHQALENESLGSIYLVPSYLQNGTFYQQNHQSVVAGDTMRFNSAMCDTNFTYEGTNVYPGVLFIGGNIKLKENNDVEINFPLLGINLRDDLHQDYPISNVTGDFTFVNHINEYNWKYYLTHNDIEFGNMMIIAVTEDDYYICYDGNVHINEFSAMGTIVSGAIQNVKAFYVTKDQLAILVNLPSQQRDYLYTLLPHVTFNGEIASRRTVWVGNVVDELEAM